MQVFFIFCVWHWIQYTVQLLTGTVSHLYESEGILNDNPHTIREELNLSYLLI